MQDEENVYITDEITQELLDRCSEYWKSDAAGHIVSSAITRSGLMPTFMNREALTGKPFVFTVDIGFEGVCNQGESGRCWAFASLNTVRRNAAEKLRVKEPNFELSQNYIYFYDQLEKSSEFLNRFIDKIDLPLDDEKVSELLRQPVADNGQWFYFARLADKYGVVPKSVMPDTQCSFDTRHVTAVLSMKLRWCAKRLKDIHDGGGDRAALLAEKEDTLVAVYGILCRFLGEPPKRFDFEYVDRSGAFNRLPALTPRSFFRAFGGLKTEDYMMVIHHPSDKRPYMQTYLFEGRPSDPVRGPQVLLNVDLPLIKQMVIDQLKGGEPVVLGADVSKQNHRQSGAMASDLYLYEELFGTPLTLGKKDRIAYREITAKHIMTFTGVNLRDDGSPDRWKVQNSYGPENGVKGHYNMMDNWFDDYVLSVVINRKYAPQEIIDAYAKEPIVISKSELY